MINVISFKADVRRASATFTDVITTGSVGIPVEVQLSSDFSGLQKIVAFSNGSLRADVILSDGQNRIECPPGVLLRTGQLWIGVYAAREDGTIVIPTVWARVGKIETGVKPSGVEPAEPAPSWVAQVQETANEAMETANGVEARADAGDFDGQDGYSPTVTVTDITGGHRVTITDANGSHTFNVMDGQDAQGSDDVFIAAYGTTTSAEIEVALTAGQIVFCKLNQSGDDYYIPLTRRDSATTHRFGAQYGTTEGTDFYTVGASCVSDTWRAWSRQVMRMPPNPSNGDAIIYDGSAWAATAVPTEVFWATYGTTTNAEIEAALSAGKEVFCKTTHDGIDYYLPLTRRYSATDHRFAAQYAATDIYTIGCSCISNAWNSWNRGMASLASPAFTGTPTAPTAASGDSSTQIATTAFVQAALPSVPSAYTSNPAALGTASPGSSTLWARGDHVHAKPTYSKSDVGLGNVDNVQQYSSTNPPPYPVTSVNGSTGAVTLSIPASASDVGAVAVAQGVGHSGEFLVVGSDGNVTTVTLATWQGGNY